MILIPKNKNIQQLGRTSDFIAFSLIAISTVLMCIYLLSGNQFRIFIISGLFFLIGVLFLLVLLITLLLSLYLYKCDWKYILIRIGILLLNIPITILFTHYGLYFIEPKG